MTIQIDIQKREDKQIQENEKEVEQHQNVEKKDIHELVHSQEGENMDENQELEHAKTGENMKEHIMQCSLVEAGGNCMSLEKEIAYLFPDYKEVEQQKEKMTIQIDIQKREGKQIQENEKEAEQHQNIEKKDIHELAQSENLKTCNSSDTENVNAENAEGTSKEIPFLPYYDDQVTRLSHFANPADLSCMARIIQEGRELRKEKSARANEEAQITCNTLAVNRNRIYRNGQLCSNAETPVIMDREHDSMSSIESLRTRKKQVKEGDSEILQEQRCWCYKIVGIIGCCLVFCYYGYAFVKNGNDTQKMSTSINIETGSSVES